MPTSNAIEESIELSHEIVNRPYMLEAMQELLSNNFGPKAEDSTETCRRGLVVIEAPAYGGRPIHRSYRTQWVGVSESEA